MRLYPHTPLYDIALKEGAVSAETDVLPPFFYVTPQVSRDRIAALLAECHRRMKNWLVGESTPELVKILGDLRGIGVAGPLWEFMVR